MMHGYSILDRVLVPGTYRIPGTRYVPGTAALRAGVACAACNIVAVVAVFVL
ncbi:hypothetical protein A2U01_0045072, partial [Trifolium medium]|nr:hypothetical protein [Trifolium medium]